MSGEEQTTWYPLKSKMQNPGRWQLSKDVLTGKAGAKQFAYFPSYLHMVHYLNANKYKSLYEILVDKQDPCFMYFDVDLPDTENKTKEVVSVFCMALSAFLNSEYNINVTWKAGMNCAYTC